MATVVVSQCSPPTGEMRAQGCALDHGAFATLSGAI